MSRKATVSRKSGNYVTSFLSCITLMLAYVMTFEEPGLSM